MTHEPADWADTLSFAPMTPQVARHIADDWHYPAPYDFYDATADPEDYEEFVTPTLWPAHVLQARALTPAPTPGLAPAPAQALAPTPAGDELVGFLTAEPDDATGTCEIALGLRPDLTGGGRGLAFLRAGLTHLRPLLPPGTRFTLAVAAFNERAITVYERAGFEVTRRYEQETNGGVYPFVAMEQR